MPACETRRTSCQGVVGGPPSALERRIRLPLGLLLRSLPGSFETPGCTRGEPGGRMCKLMVDVGGGGRRGAQRCVDRRVSRDRNLAREIDRAACKRESPR